MQRLGVELRDLLEVVLVPGLAAALPWGIGYRVLRRAAHALPLYETETHHALNQAERRGWAPDPREWALRRKLTALVDHCDHYLSSTRSDAWMKRHLDVAGRWPEPGQAALLLTFHWGAGMWALRHAGSAGLHVNALIAPITEENFGGRRVLFRYARARTLAVARALGRPFLDVSAVGMRGVLRALSRHEQVLAVIDVPSDQVSSSLPVIVADLPARIPTPLLRLAIERKIPVYVFVTGFRLDDGQRFLRIEPIGVPGSLEAVTQDLAARLDGLIRENPPAWHFWGEAERFFRA
jgi:hypothetical protein